MLGANYISFWEKRAEWGWFKSEKRKHQRTQIFIFIFWVKDSFTIQIKTTYFLTGGKTHFNVADMISQPILALEKF